jgi:hypothetical protein
LENNIDLVLNISEFTNIDLDFFMNRNESIYNESIDENSDNYVQESSGLTETREIQKHFLKKPLIIGQSLEFSNVKTHTTISDNIFYNVSPIIGKRNSQKVSLENFKVFLESFKLVDNINEMDSAVIFEENISFCSNFSHEEIL